MDDPRAHRSGPPNLSAGGLILRPWRSSDAPALREACGDEDVCRHTTVPRAWSPEAASAWIARQDAHHVRGSAIVLAVEDQGTAIGMVGLFGLLDGEARLGYWVVRSRRGRGLARSAAAALVEWSFSHLQATEVLIDVESDNEASARIAGSLGGVRAGRVERVGVVLDRYAVPRRRAHDLGSA